VCLLGNRIDKPLVDRFLHSRAVVREDSPRQRVGPRRVPGDARNPARAIGAAGRVANGGR
jgi:hypothetical protein